MLFSDTIFIIEFTIVISEVINPGVFDLSILLSDHWLIEIRL